MNLVTKLLEEQMVLEVQDTKDILQKKVKEVLGKE